MPVSATPGATTSAMSIGAGIAFTTSRAASAAGSGVRFARLAAAFKTCSCSRAPAFE